MGGGFLWLTATLQHPYPSFLNLCPPHHHCFPRTNRITTADSEGLSTT